MSDRDAQGARSDVSRPGKVSEIGRRLRNLCAILSAYLCNIFMYPADLRSQDSKRLRRNQALNIPRVLPVSSFYRAVIKWRNSGKYDVMVCLPQVRNRAQGLFQGLL